MKYWFRFSHLHLNSESQFYDTFLTKQILRKNPDCEKLARLSFFAQIQTFAYIIRKVSFLSMQRIFWSRLIVNRLNFALFSTLFLTNHRLKNFWFYVILCYDFGRAFLILYKAADTFSVRAKTRLSHIRSSRREINV